MGLVSKPFTFVAGTTKLGEASQINANFDTLYNLINGGLDDSNIAAIANIQQSKILNLAVDLHKLDDTNIAAAAGIQQSKIKDLGTDLDAIRAAATADAALIGTLHFQATQLGSDVNTASGTLVSANFAVTNFTSGGRRFLINVIADQDNTNAGTVNQIALKLDTVLKLQKNLIISTPSAFGGVNAGFSYVTDVLSAGTHTAQIWFATDNGTTIIRSGALMQVLELPAYTT